MNRFQFVDDHRDFCEVKRLCEVLKINRSSYYKWKSAAPARRGRLVADAVLGAQILAVFTAENGCYEAKRVTAATSPLHQSLGYRTPAEVEEEFWTGNPNHERMEIEARA